MNEIFVTVDTARTLMAPQPFGVSSVSYMSYEKKEKKMFSKCKLFAETCTRTSGAAAAAATGRKGEENRRYFSHWILLLRRVVKSSKVIACRKQTNLLLF